MGALVHPKNILNSSLILYILSTFHSNSIYLCLILSDLSTHCKQPCFPFVLVDNEYLWVFLSSFLNNISFFLLQNRFSSSAATGP